MMSMIAIPAHIDWDKAKCSNCMSCVIVCAERHPGMSAPTRAPIRMNNESRFMNIKKIIR